MYLSLIGCKGMEAMRLVSLAALSFCFLNIFPALAFAEGAVIGAPCPGQTGMTKLSDDNMDILACLPETPGGREVWQPMSFCQVVVNNNTYNNNTYPTYTTNNPTDTTNNPTDDGSSNPVTGSCDIIASFVPTDPDFNIGLASHPLLSKSGTGCSEYGRGAVNTTCEAVAVAGFECAAVSSSQRAWAGATWKIDLCLCRGKSF